MSCDPFLRSFCLHNKQLFGIIRLDAANSPSTRNLLARAPSISSFFLATSHSELATQLIVPRPPPRADSACWSAAPRGFRTPHLERRTEFLPRQTQAKSAAICLDPELPVKVVGRRSQCLRDFTVIGTGCRAGALRDLILPSPLEGEGPGAMALTLY